ncbi:J domain-containing protein [Halosolutus amylolyticus]|uniref:J domain-containing protein n=1 Tax=Halosolutus amylolyticus TaxID=2932267 RepID=A0ABD5PX34_9EURY|nr:J domain-containing protein [Halosolutus amylolyticus]
MESHYEVLGLSPDAEEAAVRRAYRELLTDHHPDQGGSRERFLRIKTAYEELVDERAPAAHETDGGAVPAGDIEPPDGRRAGPTYDPADRDPPGDHALTVSGHYLTLSLSGLVHDLDLDRLVDGQVNVATERTVAFFEVHNTSSRTLHWDGNANASFVGDDGFLYEGSSIVAPHADRLPRRWCGTDVDLRPGRGLSAVVIATDIPADVTVREVIYTQHVPDSDGTGVEDTERYLFEIEPLVRERLDRLPFDR